MEKKLRSLIQEKIPVELRFQLELLSRKRNIINDEKFEKIIELFREFKVPDVVPLGPGTNRYAIKIDGYVVKIATDHDGKIDNMKEFKMAKRLYPYVTKTYEVSENGTLLVAEYISPFSSYQEMMKHSDQIRQILTKLSSTYLIGDVGITSKNYANWGLRTGSNEPVCLDFAYVYEVSSSLFICRKCNANAMLVPDSDFKRLNCSNPACGAEYQFEDIRAKIGNDIHKHEIGDLKEEGYYMTSSNVNVELNEQRSNYLARKKKKPLKETKQENQKEEIEEEFTMSYIDDMMNIAKTIPNNNRFTLPIKITAEAVPADENIQTENTFYAAAYAADESEVAFSGTIDDSDDFTIEAEATPIVENKNNQTTDVIQVPDIDEETSDEDENIDQTSEEEEVKSEEIVNEEPKYNPEFTEWFHRNMRRAFSNISNRISNCLYIQSHFDDVRYDIKDKKMYPETFYKNVQNAVFRSLVSFCNFNITQESNRNGKKGFHKVFNPPMELEGTPYEDTLIFMARVWNNRDINTTEDPNMMKKYCATYSDYQGIQPEWIPVFKERLGTKMDISNSGIDKVANAIAEMWCTPIIEEEEVEEEIIEDTTDEPDDIEVEEIEEINVDNKINELDDSDDEDVIFSGRNDVDIAQYPNDESFDYEDNDNEEDDDSEEPEYLSVMIYHEDDCDVVQVKTQDAFGNVSIPFYTNLNEVNTSVAIPSIADDRNGIWDWLIHMVPDMMFRTNNPDKWMNEDTDSFNEDESHIVILDGDSDDGYIMGVYYLEGIYDVDEDGNSTANFDKSLLMKLNRLIKDEIGYGSISHLQRSISRTDLIYTEEEFMKMINASDNEEDEIREPITTAEDAAIAALMDDDSDNEEVMIPGEFDEYPTTFQPIRRHERSREDEFERSR